MVPSTEQTTGHALLNVRHLAFLYNLPWLYQMLGERLVPTTKFSLAIPDSHQIPDRTEIFRSAESINPCSHTDGVSYSGGARFLQISCFSATERACRCCFAFPLPLPIIGADLNLVRPEIQSCCRCQWYWVRFR